MKKQPDFFKIYDPQELSRLIALINLNYMFPIPMDEVSPFVEAEIDTYRTFKSEQEKSKYIDLLDSEMKMINTLNLSDSAKDLYEKKYSFPDSRVAARYLDYKALEEQAKKWKAFHKFFLLTGKADSFPNLPHVVSHSNLISDLSH